MIHHRLDKRYIVFSSARFICRAKIQTDPAPIAGTGSNFPAVPPGLTLLRPLCVCCHIPALFTRSHSVSHTLPKAFPFALESPFNRSVSTAIPPSAVLYAKPVPIYFSFSSVFLNLTHFAVICQPFLYIIFRLTAFPQYRKSTALFYPIPDRRPLWIFHNIFRQPADCRLRDNSRP